MTTAHRPTWAPAVGGKGKQEGGLGSLSKQYSVRDQAAHTKLKFRQPGQGGANFLDETELKAELDQREAKHQKKRKAEERGISVDALEEEQQNAEKRLKAIEDINPDLDADDDDGNSDSESESDDDSDDDEAELYRELQKIKEKRAVEAAESEALKSAEEDQINRESYMTGNPLINQGAGAATNFGIEKRWDDDVVFKNCARNDKEDVGFVNDTLRSQFHRRFMSKYLK